MSSGKFTPSSPVLTGGDSLQLSVPNKERRRSSGANKALSGFTPGHGDGGGRRESVADRHYHHRGSLAEKSRSR